MLVLQLHLLLGNQRKMKLLVRLLPSFGAFAWILWYCVQAKWSEVIAPNFWWLLTGTTITTVLVWVITRTRNKASTAVVKKQDSNGIVLTEKLIAREVYTWKTVTRERSVYAEPK